MTQILSRLDIESLPNYHQKTGKEWSSTCPQCGGIDRFLFWPDKGNFYCRQCEFKGFILEVDQKYLTAEQREAWQRATEERRRKEVEERQSAITKLQRLDDKVTWYHSQVNKALDYWHSQGLCNSTINLYRLGYCPACPIEPESPSYVIPYYSMGQLINLRHRLQYPNGHGKYRPEFAGLSNQLFNLDTLKDDEIPFGARLEPNELIIVEGEIKTMVLEQYGFRTIGIPGANSWREEWGDYFKSIRHIYICLDPGANGQAQKIASSLQAGGLEARVCYLPVKPDDFLIIYGGTPEGLLSFIKQGRKLT